MVRATSILACALLGMTIVGGAQTAYAGEDENAVRQALFSRCDDKTGQMRGICMQSMSSQMRSYSEQAAAQYKTCLENDNPEIVCEQAQTEFWQQLASTE